MAYSTDLRERVVAMIEAGESRREVARVLNLGAATAIRWMDRWTRTGSLAPMSRRGHRCSPLDRHQEWLLDLVIAEPDLTLQEITARLRSVKKMKSSLTSVWRFYERNDVTFKQNTPRRRARSPGRRGGARRVEG